VAYVGPGAGFAFFSAFFYVAASLGLALAALAFWPLRWLIGAVVRQRRLRGRRLRRVVVLGLDGLDPAVAERLIVSGQLPHL
jgi:hypothetical protein